MAEAPDGETSSRLEAFSDSVLSIAATLLVCELHVPDLTRDHSAAATTIHDHWEVEPEVGGRIDLQLTYERGPLRRIVGQQPDFPVWAAADTPIFRVYQEDSLFEVIRLQGVSHMPYLQLDLPHQYPLEIKRDLARRMGDLWAEIMQTTPDLVDVGFRELGEGNVWRCGNDAPQPSAVMLLEIRRDRPPEQRARIAGALVGECSTALNLRPDQFTVEFTQHTGDESYREVFVNGAFQGGFAPDWTPEEGKHRSLLNSIPELRGHPAV